MTKAILHEPGERFGRLTIVEMVRTARGELSWRCMCDCGKETTLAGYLLRSGKVISCGCYSREKLDERSRTHGKSRTRTYSVWNNMKRRTLDPSNKDWKLYGGKGVVVCEKWMTFEGFYEDMGDAPEGLSIDRIDSSKGYSKDNCRWANPLEQARNTSRCVPIYVDGVRFPTITAAVEFTGVDWDTIGRRTRKGPVIANGYVFSRSAPKDQTLQEAGQEVNLLVNGVRYTLTITPNSVPGTGMAAFTMTKAKREDWDEAA